MHALLLDVIKKGTSSKKKYKTINYVLDEFLVDFERFFKPTVQRLEEVDKFYGKTLSKFDEIYNEYRTISLTKESPKRAIFKNKVKKWKKRVTKRLPDINRNELGIKAHFEDLLEKDESKSEIYYIKNNLKKKESKYDLTVSVSTWKARKDEFVGFHKTMADILEYMGYFNDELFKRFDKDLKATLKDDFPLLQR